MDNTTIALLNNITSIEGVNDASAVLVIEGQVSYITEGRRRSSSIDIVGIQPDKWVQTAFWLPYFTLHSTPDIAMDKIAASNTSILSSFRPISYYQPGFFIPVFSDSLRLGVNTENGTVWSNCTIVDVVSNSDMQSGITYIAGQDLSSAVVVNIAYLHDILNSTEVSSFYIDLSDGANVTRAVEEIKSIAPNNFETVESPIPLVDTALTSRMNQAIMGTYSMNLLYSLIYLTIGFSIVSAIKGRNMRKQFSILRALGCESRSIMIPTLIDSLLTLIISAIIGVILGWFLAAFMSIVPLFYISNVTTLGWSVIPVRIIIPTILFIAIIGFTVLFGLASNFLVTKRILSKNIAEEIQYAE